MTFMDLNSVIEVGLSLVVGLAMLIYIIITQIKFNRLKEKVIKLAYNHQREAIKRRKKNE